MFKLAALTTLLTIVLSCNNSPSEKQDSSPPSSIASSEFLKEDTILEYDSLPVEKELDEEKQFEIFKAVFHKNQMHALYDIEKDELLTTYQQFYKILNRYNDSLDQSYTEYFKDLFVELETHEQDLLKDDTLEVRTRLEIARIKSGINSAFALKNSKKFNLVP
jgi:hypothetical protein